MSRETKKVTFGSGVCDGCGRCVEACLREGAKKRGRGATRTAGIKLLKGVSTYIPVMCRNCEDAPCVSACMSGCRQRDARGGVTTDYARCIGCWMCIMNCPFGAIEREADMHIALKCEGCPDEETPPCVAACERGILCYADIRELSHVMREKAATRFFTGEREDIPVR